MQSCIEVGRSKYEIVGICAKVGRTLSATNGACVCCVVACTIARCVAGLRPRLRPSSWGLNCLRREAIADCSASSEHAREDAPACWVRRRPSGSMQELGATEPPPRRAPAEDVFAPLAVGADVRAAALRRLLAAALEQERRPRIGGRDLARATRATMLRCAGLGWVPPEEGAPTECRWICLGGVGRRSAPIGPGWAPDRPQIDPTPTPSRTSGRPQPTPDRPQMDLESTPDRPKAASRTTHNRPKSWGAAIFNGERRDHGLLRPHSLHMLPSERPKRHEHTHRQVREKKTKNMGCGGPMSCGDHIRRGVPLVSIFSKPLELHLGHTRRCHSRFA